MRCLSSLTDSNVDKSYLFTSSSTVLGTSNLSVLESKCDHRLQSVQFWKGLFHSLLMDSKSIGWTAEQIREEFEKRFDEVIGQLNIKLTPIFVSSHVSKQQHEDQEKLVNDLKKEIGQYQEIVTQLEAKLKRVSNELEEHKTRDINTVLQTSVHKQIPPQNHWATNERQSILRKRTPVEVAALKKNVQNQLKTSLKRSNDDIQAIYKKLMNTSARTTSEEMDLYPSMAGSKAEPSEAVDVSRSQSLARELESFRNSTSRELQLPR